MPQPRKYPTNAARQAAYRARLKRRESAGIQDSSTPGTPGTQAVVARVMAADAKAT